jgi:hypothetical protein
MIKSIGVALQVNLFELFDDPFHKGFPVLIRGGHILGISKDRKRPAVSELILVPGSSYDVIHSHTA